MKMFLFLSRNYNFILDFVETRHALSLQRRNDIIIAKENNKQIKPEGVNYQ